MGSLKPGAINYVTHMAEVTASYNEGKQVITAVVQYVLRAHGGCVPTQTIRAVLDDPEGALAAYEQALRDEIADELETNAYAVPNAGSYRCGVLNAAEFVRAGDT